MTDTSWRRAAHDALERELERRGAIPDLAAAPLIAKSLWRNALKPMGFEFEVEEVATGRVDRGLLRKDRVLLGARPEGSRVRLSRLALDTWRPLGPEMTVAEGTTVVRGAWADVDDETLGLVQTALTTLVGPLPAYVPEPVDAWVLVGRIGRSNDRSSRCPICARRIEELVRLRLAYGPPGRPAHGTSAWAAWGQRLVGAGSAHLGCAFEACPDLLGDAIATEPHADRISALAPFRTAGATLTRGALVRCAACRRPIRKQAWRVEQTGGPSPLHVQCAQDSAPDALEQALANAPEGASLDDA